MLDLLNGGVAWALGMGGETGKAAGGSSGGLGGLLAGPLPMLILMFVIFYFLLIRPQQKKAKAQREMIASLKKGDSVMTSGGIYGRITGINDAQVVMEVAPQVRIKVARSSISGVVGTGGEMPQAGGKKK